MKRKRGVALLLSGVMAFTMAVAVLPADSVNAEDNVGVSMFRLYNPNSGEHFYTSNSIERDNLISLGWASEGTAWMAPVSSNTPVYRVYNPNSGEHHYTTDIIERDHLISIGWNDEEIGWFSDDSQGVPLYRLYNPNATGLYEAGAHHYTKSVNEKNTLIAAGWQDEGVGWYGVFVPIVPDVLADGKYLTERWDYTGEISDDLSMLTINAALGDYDYSGSRSRWIEYYPRKEYHIPISEKCTVTIGSVPARISPLAERLDDVYSRMSRGSYWPLQITIGNGEIVDFGLYS